jgi:hypothetical protein
MGGIPDQTRAPMKPFLIARDEAGQVRLTVRDTRYNGQGYPVVTTTTVEQAFDSPASARAHAKAHFGAEPGQFATK